MIIDRPQRIHVELQEIIGLPTHVAIEGTSGVGKSTLGTNLMIANNGSAYIPEYFNYLDPTKGETFPPFPPLAVSDITTTNHLWVQIELRRRQTLLEMAALGHTPPFFTDRSPLSLFAFEYAKKIQGLPYEVESLAGNLLHLMDVGLLQEPHGLIILLATAEETIRRIDERGGNVMDFLRNPLTINSINDFLIYYAENYMNMFGEGIVIDSTHLNEDEVLGYSMFAVNHMNFENKTSPMRYFLQDILNGHFNF